MRSKERAMTSEAIQTYAVMQARVTIFADSEMRRVTDAATKHLPRGATVSGQPTGQNNMIRVNAYSGYVSANAIAPCYRYRVSDITRVLEVPQTDAFQAYGGTAFMRPGEQFDAAMVAPGWLWIVSGVGYIPASAAQKVGPAQPSYPGGARAAHDLRSDVVHDSHNLSGCAATFCDGDLSRYLDLYHLVVRSPSEIPNRTASPFSTWRGQLVDIFDSIRRMTRRMLHASNSISNEDVLGKTLTIE
jgi:hypothetical protein